MHLCRSSSNVPRLPSFLEMPQNPWRFAHFWHVAQSLPLATQNDTWTSKVVRAFGVFLHVYFEMCFAPQRRALFRHVNFRLYILTSKCASRHNRMHFFDIATSKSAPNWGLLYMLTWTCASRHNGVQFSSLISPAGSAPVALASLLLDLPEPQIIGKHRGFCDFPYLFAHLDLLSSETFSFLILFLLFFSSLLFSSLLWLLPSLLFICPYRRKFDF